MERRPRQGVAVISKTAGLYKVCATHRSESPFLQLDEYRPRRPRFGRLADDLQAADGRLLARAGQFVHPQFIESLARSLGSAGRLVTPVKNTRLYQDLEGCFRKHIYDPIFGRVRRRDEIFWLIRNMELPQALAAEMTELRRIAPWAYEHAIVSAATAALLLKHTLPEEEILSEALVAFLVRDVGLSRIDRAILASQSKLTPRQYCQYMSHELISGVLVGRALGSGLATRIATRHHPASPFQRWVPEARQYRSEELLAMQRALEVADAYVGMISNRSFRSSPYSSRGALDALLEHAGRGSYDGATVRLLVAYCRRQANLVGIRVSRRRDGQAPAVNHFGVVA